MKNILAIILLLLSSTAFAADHYYRADCANSGDGTSLACADSPGGAGAWNNWQDGDCSTTYNPVRGDTYYFAGSDTSYGYVCIRSATGSGELTLKKVTSAQSGVSGYSADMVSKQAKFAWGMQIRSVSDVTIDGVTGSGSSGHGFYIHRTTPNLASILVGSGYSRSGLTFRGIETTDDPATLENCYATSSCNMGFELKDVTDVIIENCYSHDQMGCIISSGASNITIDGLYCAYNDSTDANHSNGWSAHYTHTVTIKNSFFQDIEGTSVISNLTDDTHDWYLYNNVFYQSADNPKSRSGTGHGVFTLNVADNTVYNFAFVNNTIYGFNLGLTSYVYLRGGVIDPYNALIQNNLWYCNSGDCKSAEHPVIDNVTLTNNYYYGMAHRTETDQQAPAGDETPFTNVSTLDFTLANNGNSALNTGATLSSTYSTDRAGTSRPQSTAWDIGAYEYFVTSPGGSGSMTGGGSSFATGGGTGVMVGN